MVDAGGVDVLVAREVRRDDRVEANQKRIRSNQATILANQKKILSR